MNAHRGGTAVRVFALGVSGVLASACAMQVEPASSDREKPVSESGHIHHAIDYIELSVTDMAEAKRFYGDAFQWQFNDYGPDYAGIRKDGGEAGGLRLSENVTAGGPLVILYSDDLDQTLANVRGAGGTITTEPFSFPGGRRFHFRDPSGNELAVWSPE